MRYHAMKSKKYNTIKVLGKLGPAQLGPGQLGPGQLGPGGGGLCLFDVTAGGKARQLAKRAERWLDDDPDQRWNGG